MLICPVRACRQALARETGRVVCASGHSFDIAKSGYLNLLQPQDRRSKLPGDTAIAVAARRRLHDRGITAPLLQAIVELAAPTGQVLDAGCGEGFYSGALSGVEAHGIDISTPAIEAAAKRYPQCEWIVANADRFIPYSDRCFSTIFSITARMNAPEFHRVLHPDGKLMVAIPAPDDLSELRGISRDRVERTVADFSPNFTMIEHRRATTTAHVDDETVNDVLHLIYRPLRSEPPRAMRLTFSLDLLLFQAAHMQ